MNKHITVILALAVAIIGAVIAMQPAFAGHQWILLHHEDQGRGQPAFEQCMPAESWEGHEDHEGDWYEGPYDNNECEPSATATNTPDISATPTEEPTETEEPSVTPTEEPTDEPTQEPPPTEPGLDVTPTEPVPTEGPGPTDTPVVPEPTPDCEEPCGWIFLLIGPDGQQAWFASFSPRPDGGWYLPSAQSQFRCLGWVAVSAPDGRPLYASDVLRSCEGGACLEPSQ